MQTLATDQTTILTGQKHKTSRNLTRLARPPHRRRTKLILRILLHRARNQGCPDWPRADGVDPNAVANLLVVQPAGEGYDCSLAGRVVEQVGTPNVGVYRGAINNCVARFHVRKGVFGEVEVGVDVRIEGFEPLVSVRCGC